MTIDPHGFLLLITGHEKLEREIYEALLVGRFAPWDRNGLPLFVVLHCNARKEQWFEGGYLAGAKCPLLLIGTGQKFRTRHVETIGRLGGWASDVKEGTDELLLALFRRRLQPTAWDLSLSPAFLDRLRERQPKEESCSDTTPGNTPPSVSNPPPTA